MKRIVYLFNPGPETPEILEKLHSTGCQIIPAHSAKEAEALLKADAGDVLLFEWPFEDQLYWIKKDWITVRRNAMCSVDEFIEELKRLLSGGR